MPFELDITLPDGSRCTIPVDGALEVGREPAEAEGRRALALDDPAVSRRHLTVEPTDRGLVVQDLGSANGTMVDGRPIADAITVAGGATIAIGDTELVVRPLVAAPTEAPATEATSSGGPTVAGGPVPAAAAALAPAPSAVGGTVPTDPGGSGVGRVVDGDGITVRARTGTAGEAVVGSVHDLAVRARRKLAGLGSESWGTPVTIEVVDPFPDPDDPDRVVTDGAVVDAERSTIWLVVTPESPPEDPHRALALLFGAVLPAAAELDHLLEGYGLHLGGAPAPEPAAVAAVSMPLEAVGAAERGPMAASFVGFLLAREDEAAFRRLLATPVDRLAEAWRDGYGQSAAALEDRWRADASREPSDAGFVDFLKLSWRYLRPYRARQAEVFGWMLLSLAFTVTYPFVSRALFDDAIPTGELGPVLTLLGILAGAFAVTLVAGLRQQYQSAAISGSVVRDLRQAIFTRLQRVPDAWHVRHPQGDVMSRLMNDVGQVQGGLSTAINSGVFQVISMVVAAVIMIRVSLVLGIVVLVGAPVVAVVYRTMSAGARTRSMAVQDEASALWSVAAENHQAAAVVRLFRLADREERRFARASDRLFRAQLRLSLFGGLFGLAVESIVTLLRLGVLGLGTWLIFQGNLTLGGLVAFLGIMGEVLSPVTGLTTLGQSIQASVGALIRIDEVLDAEVEPAGDDLPALAPLTGEIRLERVALSYSSRSRALDGVDVTIPAGSRVAFVGPSGSGKSTVLKVLMRQYEPDAGRVLVDGVDVATRSLDSWRGQLGAVFQDSFLFDATVRENIALGHPDATDAQVQAAAAAAEVDGFVADLPRGLDTLVGEGGRLLSGGQRQRVAIARALVGDPPVLVLDEATSALDPGTERQISATLGRVGAGRTVISVTHRLTSVVDHDRVFVVDGGRVVEQGTHDELLAMGGTYALLWATQTGAEVAPPPPLELAEVLAGLPLFANLDAEALAEVAGRFEPSGVTAGEVLAEGGDRLVILERGRAEVVDEATGSVVRALGRGDVFGLNALLGAPTGTALRTTEPTALLVLGADALADLKARHAAIAEGQAGRSTLAAAPSGRLVRATVGPGTQAGGQTGSGTGGFTAAEVAAAVAAAKADATGPPR